MDKLTAIQSFVEVASCGSFVGAAEKLGLSRIQVTRHIQELEAWLQLRILHRTTRRVSLTNAGEAALRYCEQLLETAAALEAHAHEHTAELQGTIRIASPIGIGQNLLLDLIEAFNRQHPQVRFQLLLSDKNAQLVDERVDIALRFTRTPDQHLIARKLLELGSLLCCSPSYIEQFGLPKHPQELTAHACLVHSAPTVWTFIDGTQVLEHEPTPRLSANDSVVLMKAAIKGMGLALLPADLAQPALTRGDLVAVLQTYPVPQQALWAVYLSRSYQQPAVRAFIDFAVGQLA